MKFKNIGFGSYRISNRIDEHYLSLKKALSDGFDLIDTSANYSDGESEILIGKVMDELIKDSIISRDQITLVTKAGYIQGQNYRRAQEMKKEDNLFSEVVELQDKLWHCISPDFLEDQISRQLERLQTDYIDIYLLHNPEYYLDDAKEKAVEVSEAREIYYERIRKAFIYLEEKVNEGKIRSYGISSNTFPVYSDDYNFTSLEEILNIANSISINNHFKTIQLPFNLIESGAIMVRNQINKTKTVLELASETGLNVLVNRPLNAITSKGLVRFSEFKAEPFQEKDFIKQMKLVSLMEEEIIADKLTDENLVEAIIVRLKKSLTFGKTIDENWKFFGSIEHYNDTVSQIFAPRIEMIMSIAAENIKDENIQDFFARYIKEVYRLLNFVSNYYKLRAEKRSGFINSVINKKLDEKFHKLTLSQKSVLLLNSVNGLSCVLAGIRKEKYVDDMRQILGEKDIVNAEEIIKFVSMEIQSAEI